MNGWRRATAEIAERRRASREREDRSPRLRDELPRLQSLHFEVTVTRNGSRLREGDHIRRFVVDQCPALFVLRCTNSACRDGGHDVTKPVVQALQASLERFTVEDVCRGTVAGSECRRVLNIVGVAEYGPP